MYFYEQCKTTSAANVVVRGGLKVMTCLKLNARRP